MPDLPELGPALDSLRAHWDRMATSTADDCSKVDASLRAQRMRFEAFVIHHDLAGASILDVGCGVGDFYAHLERRQIAADYFGADLSLKMVERCRERFPTGKFEAVNILDWNPPERFDYTTAFAIHNVRVEDGDKLLRDVTRRQFDLCRRAAHISLLTDRFAGFAPHIQPWRAEEVLTLALSITPYVTLRHDYLPNDFSVTLYRQPLIDVRKDLLLD